MLFVARVRQSALYTPVITGDAFGSQVELPPAVTIRVTSWSQGSDSQVYHLQCATPDGSTKWPEQLQRWSKLKTFHAQFKTNKIAGYSLPGSKKLGDTLVFPSASGLTPDTKRDALEEYWRQFGAMCCDPYIGAGQWCRVHLW